LHLEKDSAYKGGVFFLFDAALPFWNFLEKLLTIGNHGAKVTPTKPMKKGKYLSWQTVQRVADGGMAARSESREWPSEGKPKGK